MRDEELNCKTNPIAISGATFLVKVQFRQNTSWQGVIQWLEKEKTQIFRSELELVMLIHEAAEISNVKGQEGDLNSWDTPVQNLHKTLEKEG